MKDEDVIYAFSFLIYRMEKMLPFIKDEELVKRIEKNVEEAKKMSGKYENGRFVLDFGKEFVNRIKRLNDEER